ncbi:ABC transporter substrate-binding protein [Tsukamurella sp. 1534]|uniref:ABC transporter substrate-binding protein n=1 Tax=Tsukamurella sp. 1534 TaxID=1151061 RepID=UPI00030D4492|nr:ABC transporter substrate-binding protein [Tsukamurella sp. 1534]
MKSAIPVGNRSRTAIAATLLAFVVAVTGCGAGSQDSDHPKPEERKITDVLGRTVTVRAPAERILLGGQRLLYTTALLNRDDPTRNVVGWPDDLEQNDPDTWDLYRKKFPQAERITKTGEVWDGSLSAEQALSVRPDVFVVSAASFKAAQSAGIVDRLERAGIPTVVIDYFVEPVKHTTASVRILGELLGRQAEAEKFAGYYDAKIGEVRERLARANAPRTPTFVWRAPGYYDCCSTFARSNLAALVTEAGGANLGDQMISTPQGTVSPEAVIRSNPDVVLATGADWAPGKSPVKPGGYISLGYRETATAASDQLRVVLAQQPGFGELRAVRDRRAFGIWHHFYDSPYNYLGVQWIGKALHPNLFGDVDPASGLQELHEKFLPIPSSGTFWTGLG